MPAFQIGEGAVHKAIAFHRAAAQYQNGFAAVEFPQLGEESDHNRDLWEV